MSTDTAPQIIHTVEDLEALDGPAWLMCRDGFPVAAGQLLRAIREYGPRPYLPAAVIVPAEQVSAALRALDEVWLLTPCDGHPRVLPPWVFLLVYR